MLWRCHIGAYTPHPPLFQKCAVTGNGTEGYTSTLYRLGRTSPAHQIPILQINVPSNFFLKTCALDMDNTVQGHKIQSIFTDEFLHHTGKS